MRLFKKGTLQLTELKTPLEAITPKCLSDRIHYDYQSRSFDIVRSISNKKRDIKRMIYTKVGNTEIVNRGDRKPTCLINLEKGLKKRFFGDHGVVTSEIPSLRKSIRLNFLERTSRLKKKINAGPLTYYFLKSNETQQEIRTDLVKKSYLGRSSYFSIDEDKDLNIRNYLKSVREEEKRNRTETKSPVIHKRRLSRNDVLYESSDKLYDFQAISTNENEAKCNSTTYQKKKRPIRAKDSSKSVRYEINDVFLRFWFRYFYRYRNLIEIKNYSALASIIRNDYTTYSGRILERWFRQKLMESQQYMEIGSWWHPRRGSTGKETENEIDLVAVDLEGRVSAFEVKRNRKKYSEALLRVKVCDMQSSAFGQSEISTGCLSLEDM